MCPSGQKGEVHMSTILKQLKAAHKPHDLKFFFKKQGISQVQLSRYLNISYHSLNQYLSGYRKPPVHIDQQLESLAKDIQAEIS